MSAERPLPACIDPRLMRQALLNLIDNAVKYGPASQTITIGVEGDRGVVRFAVDDGGEGVPERDHDRIWQPYFRSERHRESSTVGSGIGLSVVREVAEAHGGKARVESGEGGGARFVIEVPRLG